MPATPKRRARNPKPGSEFPASILASRLSTARASLGISQERVAQLMRELEHEWSRATVSEVERGNRSVTVDELWGLALVYGVGPQELISPPITHDGRATNIDCGGPFSLNGWILRFWLRGWCRLRFDEPSLSDEKTTFLFELTDSGVAADGEDLPDPAREQLREYQEQHKQRRQIEERFMSRLAGRAEEDGKERS